MARDPGNRGWINVEELPCRVLGDDLDGEISLNQDGRPHLIMLPKELLLDWVAYLDMIRRAPH